MKGKVVVITGATSGIGQGAAERLVEKGARMVLVEQTVSDPRLKAVFAAPCGDYGLPPGRASALAGLAIIDHYLDGAYFPRGGSGAVRDSLQGGWRPREEPPSAATPRSSASTS